MSNHKGLYLQLHKEHDADVIERLGQCPNKQGYIKGLIRNDINNLKGGTKNDKVRKDIERD